MTQSKNQPTRKAEQLKQVAPLLREADVLVKAKQFPAALEEIRKARLIDPKNLYALAYEDRVRAIQSQAERGELQPLSPILEHVLNLALVEAERTAEVVTKQEEQLEARMREESERQRAEEGRRAAIEEKISGLIARAEEYCTKKDFHRALDEVARAYLLDPSNPRITSLEERIRTAQEEELRLQESLQAQREREREDRKRELIQERMDQLKRDREEKERKEHEARQVAQQAKIRQYISRSKELMEKGDLDAALSELVFAIVIAPLDEEILTLERQIKERQEKAELERMEEYKKRQEERQQKLKDLEESLQKQIAVADDLARNNRFAEALRVITRAMALDPMNAALQECEQRIVTMRDEADRVAEEERRRQEEAMQKRHEEELKRLEEAERKKALISEKKELESVEARKQEQIAGHLDRARKSLDAQQFEDALAEVALAFIIDPFDERVKTLEQEIRNHQEQQRLLVEERTDAGEMVQETSKANVEETIAIHLLEAERLRAIKEYTQALDEVARAFLLDPLNENVQQFETELRMEFEQHRAEQDAQRRVREQISLAKDLMGEGLFEEALAEVQKGFTAGRRQEELTILQEEIVTAQKRFLAQQTEEKRRAQLSEHTDRARQFLVARDAENARQEVEAGLLINPEDAVLAAMKNDVAELAQVLARERAENERLQALRNHAQRAKEYFKNKRYDEALTEIAIGYTVEENNSELKELEELIWSQRSMDYEASTEKSRGGKKSGEEQESERLVKIHLRAAEKFAEQFEFSKAFDEIAKASAIDPLHDEIRRCEANIRRDQAKHEKKDQPLKLIYPDRKSAADGK